MLWRGTESSSSHPEKQGTSRDSQNEGDRSGDLILELPLELLPVFERLALLPPDDVLSVLEKAMTLIPARNVDPPSDLDPS